jgi:hypothetical protein
VYIVDTIQSNNQLRKLKLGVAVLKESDNYNLSCWKLDDANNLVKAVDSEGNRYNMLDHEMCICGDTTLMREFFSTPQSQGLNGFWITVFPLQVNIARIILNDPDWNPVVLYRGGILGSCVVTPLSESSPESANIQLRINYTRMNEDNTETGVGSGFGITKKNLITSTTFDAVPVVTSDSTSVNKLQVPPIVYNENDIDSIPIGTYLVFQVLMIGNDRNIWVVTNNKSGELKLDFDLKVVFDERESR